MEVGTAEPPAAPSPPLASATERGHRPLWLWEGPRERARGATAAAGLVAPGTWAARTSALVEGNAATIGTAVEAEQCPGDRRWRRRRRPPPRRRRRRRTRIRRRTPFSPCRCAAGAMASGGGRFSRGRPGAGHVAVGGGGCRDDPQGRSTRRRHGAPGRRAAADGGKLYARAHESVGVSGRVPVSGRGGGSTTQWRRARHPCGRGRRQERGGPPNAGGSEVDINGGVREWRPDSTTHESDCRPHRRRCAAARVPRRG